MRTPPVAATAAAARAAAAPLLAVGTVVSLINVLVPGYLRAGPGPVLVFVASAIGSGVSALAVARFGIPTRFILPAALGADANAVIILFSLASPLAAGPVVLSLALPTMLVALFGTLRALVVQVVVATLCAGVILARSGEVRLDLLPHLLLTCYVMAGSGFIVRSLRLHLEATLLGARHQSVTDDLTALHNRRGFEHEARRVVALAARQGQPVTALLGDVDHFKRVNDTFGHAVGDRVLRAVAEAVRGSVRETDVVARLGGEEFVVLTTVRPEGVPELGERIRAAVADACAEWGVTISIGGSWSVVTGQHPDRLMEAIWTLVEEADERMFQAKRDGRNLVRVPSLRA